MRVGAYNNLTRSCLSLLENNLVADPFTNIKIMDPLVPRKLSHENMVLCRGKGIGRDLMVEQEDDLFRVKDLLSSHLKEIPNGKWSRDIMDHRTIHGCHHYLTCPDRMATF